MDRTLSLVAREAFKLGDNDCLVRRHEDRAACARLAGDGLGVGLESAELCAREGEAVGWI